MKATAVPCKGQGHSPLLQPLLYSQKCPQSLHKVMKDVLGALELLLLLGYAGLRLESDILHVLERGASPGKRSEGPWAHTCPACVTFQHCEDKKRVQEYEGLPQMLQGKKEVR